MRTLPPAQMRACRYRKPVHGQSGIKRSGLQKRAQVGIVGVEDGQPGPVPEAVVAIEHPAV